jgi:hypothetical protein
MSNLKNHRISKLKSPTAGKSTSEGAFRIELRKSSFSKRTWKKNRAVWFDFLLFQKQKHFKSQTKHTLNLCFAVDKS